MTQIIFDIEPFDMPAKKGVPLKIDKQIAITAEGVAILLDVLKGFNFKATFIYDPVFKQFRDDLIQKAVDQGHCVVEKSKNVELEFKDAKICGLNLSRTTIQHIPIDLYKLLVKIAPKNEIIKFKAWAFTNALYDRRYKVPQKYYKNCGENLVRRVSLLIVELKNKHPQK